MARVVILGAGQQGRIARHILGGEFAGFLDDHPGADVLGGLTGWQVFHEQGMHFHIAIGANAARARIFAELASAGARFVNAIHPRACVEPGVVLGRNVSVGALAAINIGTRIGDGVIINTGCIVEHDNVIGAHCHLAPGCLTAGEVTVGDGVFIGIGATVRDRVRIAPRCTIGAQANLVEDATTPAGVYYGNPARLVRVESAR